MEREMYQNAMVQLITLSVKVVDENVPYKSFTEPYVKGKDVSGSPDLVSLEDLDKIKQRIQDGNIKPFFSGTHLLLESIHSGIVGAALGEEGARHCNSSYLSLLQNEFEVWVMRNFDGAFFEVHRNLWKYFDHFIKNAPWEAIFARIAETVEK